MFPFFVDVPMNTQHTLGAQVRTEVREREGSEKAALEGEVTPQARYDAIWGHGVNHAVAIYFPRLIMPQLRDAGGAFSDDGDVNSRFSPLHQFALGLELVRPRYSIAIYEFGAYGPTTATALLVQKPWDGEALPPRPTLIVPGAVAVRFPLLFSQTVVNVPFKITPRVTLTPTFEYNAFGGADKETQDNTLPLTHGPSGALILDVKTTPRDAVRTRVGVARTLVEGAGGIPNTSTNGEVRFIHKLTPRTTTEVAAGGTTFTDVANGSRFYGTGEANLFTRVEGRLSGLRLGVVARFHPWLNLVAGADVEQRGEVYGAVNYGVGRTTFRGTAGAAKGLFNIRTVSEYTLVLGEAGISYRLSPVTSVDTGIRAARQVYENAIRDGVDTQIMFYGALTFAPLPARF